ncbi:MAG TPA: ATP-dependent DNA helicase [Myxococcaceae bacterium]|nr:ATP-dependent DNA helicase [Myxococcaceae bacterium]
MNELLTVDALLGPRGALASALDGYEFRPEQLEVARAVERAFSERGYLMAEAGTGTGKTLAYLVPAILSGRKVLVSTATKNLQEQILYKDVPLLRRLGLSFQAAVLKGRANYLCQHRFEAMAAAPALATPEDARAWPELVAWVEHTETGDRAELDLPDDSSTWRTLSTNADTCLGLRCPFYESCFVTRARRRAEAADIVVVNHHLFFADLALKSRGAAEGGWAALGVLPRYDVVVFDEAHALEDVATEHFGLHVSTFRVEDLVRDAQRTLAEGDDGSETLAALATRLQWHSDAFFRRARVQLGARHAAVRIGGGTLAALPEREELLEALSALGAFSSASPRPERAALARRSAEIAEHLELVALARDPRYVYWGEARGRGLFLHASPIEIADDLRRRLYGAVDTLVFTSATLTAQNSFSYFARRMGLHSPDEDEDGRRLRTVSVPSPFDYRVQAALYVPDHLPDPSAPHFAEAVADEIVALAAISGGRAFALFTSLRNMEAAWAAARDRLPYQVLLQGERPKSALLDAFRAAPSVLFASHSFWEGVDVPGEALSLVVIDKLPFASPADPRVSARIDLLRQRGEDPFSSYQLPGAAIALRQGFGRLIRSSRDRGIVAILDPRLHRRHYARAFLASLPPARRIRDLAQLRAWYADTPSRAPASATG